MDDDNIGDKKNKNANTVDRLRGFRLLLGSFFSLACLTLRDTQKLSNLFKIKQCMVDLGLKTANVLNSTSPMN